jgi:alanine dehydrogenase
MATINITYLNGRDIERIALTDREILEAVEQALIASGRGETVIEPRSHLIPNKTFSGHFNILRGYVAPLDLAGVKVVGDFRDNYKAGLPSEMAILNLFDPWTGMPRAIIDATAITDMRTGALTAIGARHLARSNSRILGHVGARGTSYWNIRLLDRIFNFAEIRVHSRRPESREGFAQRLTADLGKPVVATEDWESCFLNADILVEASRLDAPAPLLKSSWVKPGALVIPYGTMSALELDLTDRMDKIVVDDRGQMLAGPFGALRPHINAGKVSPETVYAEIGEICAGLKPGRVSDDETILFWHRGLATSDIALGAAMLDKAVKLNIGTSLVYR